MSKTKAEELREKIETIVNDMFCLEAALQFTHLTVAEEKSNMNKQIAGVLELLSTRATKVLKESSEVESLIIGMTTGGEPA